MPCIPMEGPTRCTCARVPIHWKSSSEHAGPLDEFELEACMDDFELEACIQKLVYKFFLPRPSNFGVGLYNSECSCVIVTCLSRRVTPVKASRICCATCVRADE